MSTATDPIDQLRGLSHRLFPEWAARLASITSVDIGLRNSGGWYIADTPGERAAMIGMTGYWEELQIECEQVSLDTLASREPALGDWIQRNPGGSAWWVPDEYQIRPPRFLRALADACHRCGVELVEQSPVSDIRLTDRDAQVRLGDQWARSDSIIVCAGTWTGRVAAMLGLERSVVPVRGQILLLKTERPLLCGIVNVGQRYVLCRDDGHTLVGSCEEEVGFQLGTSAQVLDWLHEFAVSMVQPLSNAQRLGAWSGLRPLTFDGFPMIGRVPETSNLYVAAGHFRSGLHLSPGTAVTIADLVTGQPPQLNVEAFGVGKQQCH